ncbi:MAG: B12-binding domain-containing radical SAM protein [Thermodesulfovibrionales bacterium]
MSKLLIINCPSEYFIHIPMGTFGLCDYLYQRNIQSKILNLSLYPTDESETVIKHYVRLFNPSYVALVLHWQETAEGFIEIGQYLKSNFKNIRIISGGFTAGYFGKDLLESCQFLDYVIRGDPERPLELLLKGAELSEIPNLIYRTSEGIFFNERTYLIDTETLSSISFCNLTYLYDQEIYIKILNEKLGFPIFIGRGCRFSCRYCGGSYESFRLHSGRNKQVVRSISSIITDLKHIKDYTRKIYICYENDRDYIKKLFKAMKKEGSLVRVFRLNYGAWHLLDREFLELYKDLFIIDGKDKPLFELSPEVFDDNSRQKIKPNHISYSINELKENLFLIKNHLGDRVVISIFFSRYHETHKTYDDIKKEIVGFFRLKNYLVYKDLLNVRVHYDHLSTDVASCYWESNIKNPHNFETLISAVEKVKKQYKFPVENLCIYIPETLSEEDVFRCEFLITILKMLEKYLYEMLHIILKCLDEKFIDIIEKIINEKYIKDLKITFDTFKIIDPCELLSLIKERIRENESLNLKVPFIEDLISLNIKKTISLQTKRPDESFQLTSHPRINHEFISINEHDYLDLQNFLKRLEHEGVANLKPEKTVFIFLKDEILSMPFITYRATLKEFEKGISVDEYYTLMNRRKMFDISYHKELVEKLFESKVLY